MSHRRILAAVACTAIALTTVFQAVPARAQDATASVLAERAELDKALAVQDATQRIPLLEQFLAEHPESLLGEQAREALVRSHASIGELALKNRDPRAAAEAFERAVASAGDKIGERLFQNVIWPMPAIMARAGFRFEGIQLMRSLEERFAAEPSRLVRIGYFYVSIESPPDAVRVLERAVELAPDDGAAYGNLGTAYIISLRLDDAATAFQKAIELEPKSEFAYVSLGNLRRAFGNPTEAIELYKKQLEVKPDDPESYSGLAMAYLLNDDDASASQALAHALALAPSNFRLYSQLAYFYAARGRWEKAREMVDLSMKYEPRFAWTHIVAGNVLLGQKQYDRAIEVLLGAQQYGDFPTLHFELAKAYMVDDRFTEAVEELRASFDITDDGQFETRLGDVLDARSSKLDLLLERERQAVLAMPIQPTTETQYRLAESLARIAHFLSLVPDDAPVSAPPVEEEEEEPRREIAERPAEVAAPVAPAVEPQLAPPAQQEEVAEIYYTEPRVSSSDAPLVYRPRRTVPAPEPVAAPSVAEAEVTLESEPEPEPEPEPGGEVAAAPVEPERTSAGRVIDPALRDQLAAAIEAFVGVDDGREAFRKMWVARQLAEKRVLLDKAEDLAKQALDGVETAVALDGSVRDIPEADLATRSSVALARAQSTLGWVMFERGERAEGIDLMRKAVTGATNDPEQIARLWRLGIAEQENGNERQALDLYLQAYDPASPSAPVRKQIIEALYVKVNGSTEGLDRRLSRQ